MRNLSTSTDYGLWWDGTGVSLFVRKRICYITGKIKRMLYSDWLPELARWAHLALSGSREKNSSWPQNKPRPFFIFCVFNDLDFVSVHKDARKRWKIQESCLGLLDQHSSGLKYSPAYVSFISSIKVRQCYPSFHRSSYNHNHQTLASWEIFLILVDAVSGYDRNGLHGLIT